MKLQFVVACCVALLLGCHGTSVSRTDGPTSVVTVLPGGDAARVESGRQEGDSADAPRPRVEFKGDGGWRSIDVEVARSVEQRRQGLMGREVLEPGTGMLFIFEEEGSHAFWMKNTLISLDLIFLTSRGRVSGVVAEAVPHDLTPRGGGFLSRYVVEVPGGWAATQGIVAGMEARFEGIALSENAAR